MRRILIAVAANLTLVAPAIADSISVVVKERATEKYHTIEKSAAELNRLKNGDQYLSVEPNVWITIPQSQQHVMPYSVEPHSRASRRYAPSKLSTTEPSDPEYSWMYYWQSQTLFPGSSEINNAVNKSIQNKKLRIAVIDGGFNEHQDIPWRIDEGHNFFQAFGQTINPQWRSLDDINDCEAGHGNAVGAIIGAIRDNNIGIAGILDAELIPIRTFECNMARLSDVSDAIRFAAGEQVKGSPRIAKVDIINISSEGLNGNCPSYLQDAIDLAISKNIQIYASAGNSNVEVSEKCKGIMLVAASDQQALKWQDSNYGAAIDFMVAGYDVVSYSFGDDIGWWEGTSFAAPNAVGIHGLAKQHAPTLAHWDIVNMMKSTAQPMNTNVTSMAQDCAGNRCGAGLLNASRLMDSVISKTGITPFILRHALSQSNSCDQQLFISDLGNKKRLCALYELVIDPTGAVSEYNLQVYRVLKELELNELNAELISETNETIMLLEDIHPSTYDYGVRRCQGEACDQAPIVQISLVDTTPAICQ